MQTHGPKLGGILIAAFFALAAACVTIFFWRSFGGATPLSSQSYRFAASFPQAANLYPNADVRVAGVNVGKVVGVRQAGQRTNVVIQLDSSYAPLPDDAHAILRNKTVLGETYVELTPGSPDAPKLPEGGQLPRSQVAGTQRLDQVLQIFNAKTRSSFRRFVTEVAAATHGRGLDLNAALGQAPRTVSSLSTVVSIIDRQRPAVQRLVADSAQVLEGLGTRRADLESLITAGDRVLRTTDARGRELTATVDALPPFLHELRGTLAAYRRSAKVLGPSLRELRSLAPGLRSSLDATTKLAPELAGLFRGLPAVMSAARTGLPAATRALRASKPLVDALYPAGRQIEPFYELAAAYRRDIGAAVAKGAAASQATALGASGRPIHYLRVLLPLLNEGFFGYGKRSPTNRHNPYPRPGALTDYLHGGLRAWDCNNLSNPQIFPPLGAPLAGAPPCRVQQPWSFDGVRRSFPHLRRAK